MMRTMVCSRQWIGGLAVAMSLGGAALLGSTPSIYAGVQLTANALIMDGTTFPNPSQGFQDSAINDFISPSAPNPDGYTPVAVWTPEQVIGINNSVDGGVDSLLDAMAGQQGPYVVFGFSQSTVVSMKVKAELSARKARGEAVPDVTFVGIGVGNRPNGGIAERFAGVTIPFFDFTFNGAAPTDPEYGFTTIDIARQYDGLADTPQFPINLVSTANALLGIVFAHALYGPEVSLDPDSPKYVPGTVKQQYGDTTYYWIPTEDLPLLDPLRLVGVPEPVLDIVEPFLTVLVEAGYDRSIPFGEPTPAQLIPVIDPVTLTVQLAASIVEGANNAAAILGGELPGYDAITARLDSAEAQSSSAIGAPYRDVVRSVNELVNPFQAFAAIEGPLAQSFDSILNDLGVPTVLNTVIDPVLTPVTRWAEEKVLYPQPDSAQDPLASALIHVLRRIAPQLGTTSAQPADRGLPAGRAAKSSGAVSPTRQDQRPQPITQPVSRTLLEKPMPARHSGVAADRNESVATGARSKNPDTTSLRTPRLDARRSIDRPTTTKKSDHPRRDASRTVHHIGKGGKSKAAHDKD